MYVSLPPSPSLAHTNGSTENCASVSGTIPVKIRGTFLAYMHGYMTYPPLTPHLSPGQQYNIPICIWVRRAHPYVSPLVFVTPTSGMGIQQSQYVDTNGMVYLPFLSEWRQVGVAGVLAGVNGVLAGVNRIAYTCLNSVRQVGRVSGCGLMWSYVIILFTLPQFITGETIVL